MSQFRVMVVVLLQELIWIVMFQYCRFKELHVLQFKMTILKLKREGHLCMLVTRVIAGHKLRFNVLM